MPLTGDGQELLGLVIDARYRLDAVLGRGGMGLVFRATHLQLRRSVAVKILHPSLAASHDVRSRFEREALAVGKIDHPNCVATFDVGRLADDSLYLAMELLEGRPLADVLAQEGQLEPQRALHILRHILCGLASIHNAGLIHRDIKPENIFVVRQGDDADFAKILDFGIAKPMVGELVDDGVRLTQAGMAFGTPIYMSPEQALGNKLDGRADLYAAAVIGYEMLAGQLPFYSDDRLEVMSMHVAKPVPAMHSRMRPDGRPVPPAIERLIGNGLTKKTDDRYARAEDFIAAIDDALQSLVTDVAKPQPRSNRMPVVAVPPADFDTKHVGQESSHSIDELLLQLPPAPSAQQQPLAAHAAGDKSADAPTKPRPMRNWRLYSSVLAGAVIVGVAAGFLTAPRRPTNRPSGSTPQSLVERFTTAKSAVMAAPRASSSVPVSNARNVNRNPQPPSENITTPAAADTVSLEQLARGHASVAGREPAAALIAYDKALSLAPALSTDATLRANLAAMAATGTLDVAMRAFDVWLGRTDDPAATTAVVKAAVSRSIERRYAARSMIDRYTLTNRVDWVTSYGLDLEQESTCQKRRDAVAHLRALKLPAAIPALERAMAKRQRRRNACLVDDARAAIRFLRRIAARK